MGTGRRESGGQGSEQLRLDPHPEQVRTPGLRRQRCRPRTHLTGGQLCFPGPADASWLVGATRGTGPPPAAFSRTWGGGRGEGG